MKRFFLLIALAGTLLTFPSSSKAANLDLSVSPVFLDYSPKPGDVIKDKVRIHNNTNTVLPLEIKVNKMSINDRGDIVPEEVSPTDPATRWFKFNTNKISAPAKEWYDVPFTITIPAEASFGNYFAIVFSLSGVKAQDSTTVIQGNVLVPILINVKKDGMLAQAKITSFEVESFINESLPVNFNIEVANTGNVHVHPRGNIFIRGNGEKDVAILEVNPGLSNILPTTSRTFISSWTDGFMVKETVMEDGVAKLDSNGKPLQHLKINWNKLTDFRLGKYTAYLLLAYDDGKRDVPIDATLTFWVFPYTAVIVTIIGLVILFSLVSYIFKVIVKKEAQKLKS